MDLNKKELVGSFIPVIVVLVLSDKGNGSLSVVWIKHWHVDIINEVDKLVLSNWSEVSTGLLLEELLKRGLEGSGVGVVVEVDDLLKVVFGGGSQIVKETLDDLSLTATGLTDEEWGVSNTDEESHQVLSRDGVNGWHGIVRDRFGGVDGVLDVLGLEGIPLDESGLLDEVVENGTLGWELDGLPSVLPPVGEFLSVVSVVLLSISSTNAPDAAEHEDVFESNNFGGSHDALKEFTDGNDEADLDLWHDVVETLFAMQ